LFKVSDGDYFTRRLFKDYWTPDFGTGIIGKKILDLPRNLYLGATWSNGRIKLLFLVW
jgi:iron complex outermembrane receptor protein